MNNNATVVYAILLVVGDFLALTAAFVLAYVIRVKFDARPLVEQIPARGFFTAVLTVLPLWIATHGLIGLYSKEIFEKRIVELGRLIVGSFLGILIIIGYDFVSPEALFPARLVPVYGLGIGFVFLLVFRSLARLLRRELFKYGIGISNVLIVGNTPASLALAKAVSDTKHTGQKVIGLVGKKSAGFDYFKNFAEALRGKNRIHSIIQTELYADQDQNNDILKYSQEHHAAFRFVPGNSDLFVGNIAVELLDGMPVIAVHQTALIGWGRVIKRIFDIVVCSLLLVVAVPVILIVAILIKLFDFKGPVFFRQIRLTRFNRQFTVYKFRSMKSTVSGLSDKDAFLKLGRPELYPKYVANGFALDNDPRHTSIGRFLRRTSIDELPQLFNVIKGDLSLVGPRALVPHELTAYEKHHAILSVKSGITGLAQISGRQNISFEERRKLDIYYVQNWSFWLDIVILLKTLRVVLTGSGAK